MGNETSQTALEEYEEFYRERQAAAEAEDRGETALTIALEEKWFDRYPHLRLRSSLYRSCNRLEDFLEARAKE